MTEMWNIVSRSFGTVDPEITWEILTEDIPKLKVYCQQIIEEAESAWIRYNKLRKLKRA